MYIWFIYRMNYNELSVWPDLFSWTLKHSMYNWKFHKQLKHVHSPLERYNNLFLEIEASKCQSWSCLKPPLGLLYKGYESFYKLYKLRCSEDPKLRYYDISFLVLSLFFYEVGCYGDPKFELVPRAFEKCVFCLCIFLFFFSLSLFPNSLFLLRNLSLLCSWLILKPP